MQRVFSVFSVRSVFNFFILMLYFLVVKTYSLYLTVSLS